MSIGYHKCYQINCELDRLMKKLGELADLMESEKVFEPKMPYLKKTGLFELVRYLRNPKNRVNDEISLFVVCTRLMHVYNQLSEYLLLADLSETDFINLNEVKKFDEKMVDDFFARKMERIKTNEVTSVLDDRLAQVMVMDCFRMRVARFVNDIRKQYGPELDQRTREREIA